MGGFYTNFTLRGPSLDAVQEYLNAQDITAYIAAPQPGFVVVYDQESESQDDTIITARAGQLSRQFACPALAVLNHDDDVFVHWLFDKGEQIDFYDSVPGYFTGEETPPTGEDAAALCRAFGVDSSKVDQLETLLRAAFDDADAFTAALGDKGARRVLDVDEEQAAEAEAILGVSFDDLAALTSMLGGYVGAMDRHQAIVDVLGLPGCTVGWGFDYVALGEFPPGLSKDDLRRCGPAAE